MRDVNIGVLLLGVCGGLFGSVCAERKDADVERRKREQSLDSREHRPRRPLFCRRRRLLHCHRLYRLACAMRHSHLAFFASLEGFFSPFFYFFYFIFYCYLFLYLIYFSLAFDHLLGGQHWR